MSQGKWYGEPLKKTSCSLPMSIYKQAKAAHLDFSRHLRIGLLKTLKGNDEIMELFLKISNENKDLKIKITRATENNWELRQRLAQIEQKVRGIKIR